MTRWGSDPKVKEWMKEHKAEVGAVAAKYDELKELSLEELLKLAPNDVVAKVRSVLITGIIKSE